MPTSPEEFEELVRRHARLMAAAIRRVCGRNVPIPYNLALERLALPQEEDLEATIREVVAGAV